jgi:hypothetical protein
MSPSRWSIRSCLLATAALAAVSCDSNMPSELPPTEELTLEQAQFADLHRLTELLRTENPVGNEEVQALVSRVQARYSPDPSLVPTERPSVDDFADLGDILKDARNKQQILRAEIAGDHPAAAVSSNILRVPSTYATIQEAVDAARPGDEIHVSEGVYDGTLLILQNDITIIGAGAIMFGGAGIINLGDNTVVAGMSTILTAFGIANLGTNFTTFAANEVYGALAGVWCLQTTLCRSLANQITLTVVGMGTSIVAFLDGTDDEDLFVGYSEDINDYIHDVTDTQFYYNTVEFSGVGAVALGPLLSLPASVIPDGEAAYEADTPSAIEDLIGLQILGTDIQENTFFQNAVSTALVSVSGSTIQRNTFKCSLEDIFRLEDARSLVHSNFVRQCPDGFLDLPTSQGGRIF